MNLLKEALYLELFTINSKAYSDKIKLNDNIVTLSRFLKIKEFTDYNSQSKSIYWQHHSKQVNFSLKINILY